MATQTQTEKIEKQPPDKWALQGDIRAQVAVDVDRVLEIVRTLPTLRRYGGDEQALKDVVSLLEKIKERL